MKKMLEEYQDIILDVFVTGLFFTSLAIVLNGVYKLCCINMDFLM